MTMNVCFNYTCSCGKAGSVLVSEPVVLDAMYVGQDCQCGHTIIVIPKVKHSDYQYEYTVRILQTVREEPLKQ